ncbi:MAG: Hpt domain-containing protein, partial [Burkholderiales bacterium]
MDKKEKDFQEKLLSIFRVEAAEHIQVLSSGLVELERSRTTEERLKVIETIFREAHSLKGAARAVGLGGIESIC